MFKFRKVDVAAIRHMRKLRLAGVMYEDCCKALFVLGGRCGSEKLALHEVPSVLAKHGDAEMWAMWRRSNIFQGWNQVQLGNDDSYESVFEAGRNFGMQWAARQELVTKAIEGDSMMENSPGHAHT